MSLFFAGKRSWRICFNGSLSVKRIKLLYSVVKEHERRKSSFLIYRVGKEQKRNQYSKLFSFPVPYRERKCHSAKLMMKRFSSFHITLSTQFGLPTFFKTFLLSLHIGTAILDLMSCFEKKLNFLFSHHICTQVTVLLQIF